MVHMTKSRWRCCRVILQIVLFILNLILFLIGFGLVGVLMWGWTHIGDFISKESYLEAIALVGRIIIGIMVAGALLGIIALLGMLISCIRQKSLMLIYAVLLAIFVLATVICCFVLISKPKYYGNNVRIMLTEMLEKKYYGSHETGVHKNHHSFIFDAMNIMLKCCGVNNHEDFFRTQSDAWRTNALTEMGFEFKIPVSCCKFNGTHPNLKVKVPVCIFTPDEKNSWFQKGCWGRIEKLIAEKSPLLMLGFWVITIIEIICIILAALRLLHILKTDKEDKKIHYAIDQTGHNTIEVEHEHDKLMSSDYPSEKQQMSQYDNGYQTTHLL